MYFAQPSFCIFERCGQKSVFQKKKYYVPKFLGFQTEVILDPNGVKFHGGVGVGFLTATPDFLCNSERNLCLDMYKSLLIQYSRLSW